MRLSRTEEHWLALACTATDRLVVLRTKENPSAAWLGEIRLTESSVAALLKQINDGVQSALKARDKEAAATTSVPRSVQARDAAAARWKKV